MLRSARSPRTPRIAARLATTTSSWRLCRDHAVDALARTVELNRLGVVDPASFDIGASAAKQARWIQGHHAMQWGGPGGWTRSNDPAVSNIVGDVAVGLIPGTRSLLAAAAAEQAGF